MRRPPAAPNPSLPYVLPFGVCWVFLGVQRYAPIPPVVEFPLRIVVVAAVLYVFSRHVIDLRSRHLFASACLGIAVFLLWIGPDVLFPGYRQHWLFQNSLMETVHTSLPSGAEANPWVLLFRSARAVILVPIIEELFWRAWLMRWLISPRFESVPLGAYSAQSFWITAVLFASEHGPFWDVGLAAGIIYNWWMIRTRSLGDCILAHAVTNACLCGYVIAKGRWEYWL